MSSTNTGRRRSTKAINFTPAGSWAEASAAAVFDFEKTQPFSCALWVKNTYAGGSGQLMVGKIKVAVTPGVDRGWYFELSGSQRPGFFIAANYTPGTDWLYVLGTGGSVSDGNWHHLACTYDGSVTHAGMLLYVDGTSQGKSNFGGPLVGATVLNSAVQSLGGRRNAGGTLDTNRYQSGSMQEIALWNSALTGAQVLDAYQRGKRREYLGTMTPAPVAYWSSRSGSTAATIPDRIGTQHFTTIASPTLFTR